MKLQLSRYSSRGRLLAGGGLLLLTLVLVAVGALWFAPSAQAIVGGVQYEWVVTNLTNTPYVDEELPDICGNNVVWNTWDDGHNDVYLHDLLTGATTNLTNTPDVDEWGASISDDYAMWNAQYGWAGSDVEMDGIRLSDGYNYYSTDNFDEEWPSLAGGWGVWQFITGGRGQIFALNFPSNTYYNWEDSYDDYCPRTDGSQVVWYGWDGANWEIFYVDFSWSDPEPWQLTNCTGNDKWPDIDGDHVVWVHQPRNNPDDGDIIFYDMGSGESLNISGGEEYDGMPRVSGELVTWERDVLGGVEVRLWDSQTGETTVLSEGIAWSMEPNIDGYSVVWEGASSESGQTDIYLAQYLPVQTQHFPDVYPSNPYFTAIEEMFKLGVISGYDNGYFGPGDPVIRQQFAKMIVLTMGYPVTFGDTCPFRDVDKVWGDLYPWHFVGVAARTGLTTGYDDGTFKPYRNISRMQMITMVVRAASLVLDDPPTWWSGVYAAYYSNPWHGENIRIAEYNGLLGDPPLPGWDLTKNATRGEVAQMLWNLLASVSE